MGQDWSASTPARLSPRWPMGTSPAFCVLCGAFVVLSGALAGPDVPGRLPGRYDVRT